MTVCARCEGRGTISTENIIGDPEWEPCPMCAPFPSGPITASAKKTRLIQAICNAQAHTFFHPKNGWLVKDKSLEELLLAVEEYVGQKRCPFVDNHDQHEGCCPRSVERPGEGPFPCTCLEPRR